MGDVPLESQTERFPSADLHFSPRGEAKCGTGTAGRGANRPRRQHGPRGFSRNTRHETRNTAFFRNTSFTALRCAVQRKSGIEGGRTKKPKSDAHPAVPAITSRLACPPLDAIGWLFCCPVTASPAAVSHYSPLFPVISRGLGGLGGSGGDVQVPFAGNPGKVHKIPLLPGKCVKRSVRLLSRRPPGSFRLPQMEPHAEKGERSTLRRSGRILLDIRFNWTYD